MQKQIKIKMNDIDRPKLGGGGAAPPQLPSCGGKLPPMPPPPVPESLIRYVLKIECFSGPKGTLSAPRGCAPVSDICVISCAL